MGHFFGGHVTPKEGLIENIWWMLRTCAAPDFVFSSLFKRLQIKDHIIWARAALHIISFADAAHLIA